MPQTTVYDRTGEEVGASSSATSCSPPRQHRRPAPGRDRAAGQPADRHRQHQDPRRGPRRRPQAVPPEGHRRARQGTVTAPHHRDGGIVFGPQPRSYEQRPAEARCGAWRSVAPCPPSSATRRHQGHRHLQPGRDPDQGAGGRARHARHATGSVLVVVTRARPDPGAVSARNLPKVEIDPGRLPQRRRPADGRSRPRSSSPRWPGCRRLRMSALTAPRSSCAP